MFFNLHKCNHFNILQFCPSTSRLGFPVSCLSSSQVLFNQCWNHWLKYTDLAPLNSDVNILIDSAESLKRKSDSWFLLRFSITSGVENSKLNRQNAFFAAINQMFGGSFQHPNMLFELRSTIWFDNRSLGSSRKQGAAAEHLIEGSEKRICRLSFEVWSPHVIEKRSKSSRYYGYIVTEQK